MSLMPHPRKKRRPILLMVVSSLAVATVLYLEFFAHPIIDPPEFFSANGVQIQYLVARSPFSRRVLNRLVTVDRLSGPTRYEFRGRDVLVASGRVRAGTGVILASGNRLSSGTEELFDLLWDQRGYIRHLRERPLPGGFGAFLRQAGEVTGDEDLFEFCYASINCTKGPD